MRSIALYRCTFTYNAEGWVPPLDAALDCNLEAPATFAGEDALAEAFFGSGLNTAAVIEDGALSLYADMDGVPPARRRAVDSSLLTHGYELAVQLAGDMDLFFADAQPGRCLCRGRWFPTEEECRQIARGWK